MFTSLILCALISSAHSAPSNITNLNRRSGTPLEFFTDQACSVPSTTTPSVSLGLDICAVTTGLESFIINPQACSSGSVNAWAFADPLCANSLGALDWYHGAGGNNYCQARYKGAFAAIMLGCIASSEDKTPPTATATTTFAVGSVADGPTSTTGGVAATTTASSGGSGSGSSSGSSTTTSTAASASSSSKASGWNSLDYGTKVGVIVSLAMGIPSILIAAWVCMRRRH